FKLERQALLNTWERLGVSAEAQAHALKSLVARRKDNFKSSWKLAPLPKELVFSLQDGLVKISAKDPLIAVSIGESGYLYRTALYFAKDAGRWRIVKFDWAIPQ
ncbi:MAG: hypothetical protein O7B35_12985, partial [Deltaproteobacteria bacterium]|nr:hypothetical protein [Deltaproteobacteria bacterium]